MAIPADCFPNIFREAGRELTEREVRELGEQLEANRQSIEQQDPSISPRDAEIRAAEKLARDLKLAAVIQKRNAILNQRKRIELKAYLENVWGDRPTDGLQAILTGSQRGREGARLSAAIQQEQLNGKYLGGLTADIQRTGNFDLFRSGAVDDQVARALWQLDAKEPKLDGLMPEAVAIARAVKKWQDVARLDANREGAFIGKELNYITRQSHDIYKIRRAGYEAWRDAVAPKLDLARMNLPREKLEGFLGKVYEGLASGVHLKADTAPKLGGFQGPANLAKRASQERVLHFKSADDWLAYNERFGTGSVREAIYSGLRNSARSTGLMKVLGTSPESMIQVLARDALERISDPAAKQKFAQDIAPRGKIDNRLRQVDGSVNIPVNETAARVSANMRAVESMAKLGAAVFSSITDVPTYASEVRFQGRGMLTGMAEALGGIASGRPSGERAQVLSSLGVVFDSMVGEITRRGSLDDQFSAGVGRAMNTFFKWNLLNWWTESLRGSAALGMSHFMAKEAGKAFDQLHPQMQNLLGRYKIGAAQWDVIRASGVKLADGREYLTPEGIADETLAGSMRAFYIDRAETAVIQPDAETLALMRQGTQAGTAYGELLRFIGQFKSFGVAFTQKILGREVYGYGSDSIGQGLTNLEGIRGISNVILMTTLFGYGAMAAKDLIKGRNPRDPTEFRTWAAAMIQGGGLGIYGDFLLGEHDRFGGDLLKSLAGPVPGLISDVDKIRAAAFRGEDVAATSLRTLINNTPYANLFYTRMALDYAILYEIQESMNPGYLRRMERRMQKENNQTYWLRPSEAAR
jgi:hypothetical protein